MEQIYERVAGLDVHRDSVSACVRVPGMRSAVVSHKVRYATTTAGLAELADWLQGEAVTWWAGKRRASIGSRASMPWRTASRCGCATPITSRTCPDARPTCPTRR